MMTGMVHFTTDFLSRKGKKWIYYSNLWQVIQSAWSQILENENQAVIIDWTTTKGNYFRLPWRFPFNTLKLFPSRSDCAATRWCHGNSKHLRERTLQVTANRRFSQNVFPVFMKGLFSLFLVVRYGRGFGIAGIRVQLSVGIQTSEMKLLGRW